MAISRSQLVKELEPGLNALFGLEYARYEQEHTEIFDQESSDRAFEEEVMLSVLDQLQLNLKVLVSLMIQLLKLILHVTHTIQLH
jgi:hypothetical protein